MCGAIQFLFHLSPLSSIFAFSKLERGAVIAKEVWPSRFYPCQEDEIPHSSGTTSSHQEAMLRVKAPLHPAEESQRLGGQPVARQSRSLYLSVIGFNPCEYRGLMSSVNAWKVRCAI